MERKKRLIILSIIVSSLVLIFVLSSALFAFRSASVECRTTGLLISESDYKGIIDSADFDYGKNILFQKFTNNIENIEKAYPYVKVINIERKFPNYAVINIRERVPAVRIDCNNGQYCLDADLKVLNVIGTEADYNKTMGEDKTPKIVLGLAYSLDYVKTLEAGSFVTNNTLQKYVSTIFNGLVDRTEISGSFVTRSCISMVHTVTLTHDNVLESDVLTFEFVGDSRKIELYDTPDLETLTDNLYKVFQVYVAKADLGKNLYRCSSSGVITAE